ncbi:UDP-glucose 4-epimerase [subsurface metagenome]
MRILITGGAGFLGSHLGDYLLAKGHQVIALDNLITGKVVNIVHLAGNEHFQFIKQDVTEYLYLKGKIDYILHFASPASPLDYQKYPIQTLKVGSLGTHKALGLAREKKAKFLLASTSEVYGDPQVSPQKEDYWGNVNSLGPRGMYDESKRFAEALTMAYHRYHKIDTKIARIFNSYGPRMRKDDGRVVPTFVNQALKGQPLTVFGDGSQTRSFCYVSDLVEGIYKLMVSEIDEPVNLGSPDEMSILDFARSVLEITRSQSKVTYKPLPENDPRVRRPDISRAKKYLKWQPKVELREGLKKTLAWFGKET